jgi:cytochrome P450
MTEVLTEALFAIADGPQRHARYAELAATAPVHRIVLPTGQPGWLITGYEEVRRALRSREPLSPEVAAAMSSHMLNRNPPDHTRLRRLLTAAFTRRRIEQLAPRIQQITDELLDAIANQAQVDLIGSFALPLPITVICELLGVPAEGHAKFRAWTSIILTGVSADPDVYYSAATAQVRYIQELLETKRAVPTDDLLSALVTARDDQDRLSENELTSMVFMIILGGYQTTANLIGNGVHALLTHPEQLSLLHAQPPLLDTAIDELLRFTNPLLTAPVRVATEPIEISGVTIPAGGIVAPCMLTANLHPACTAQPDTLDITRTHTPHLTFGHGIRHCLGASLARLEGRIALGTLLTRFPRLRLAVPVGQLTWRPGMVMNSLDTLPVILREGLH